MVVGAAPRGRTRVTTVSVWLGGVVERKLLPYAVKHLLQPSVVDHAGRRVLVLVDAEPSAHVRYILIGRTSGAPYIDRMDIRSPVY
jgi:hypothetical protein